VAERKDGDLSVADHLEPMTDRQLMTSVASLLIDTIRPTLIWRTTVIEVDGGFVLVVEVDPSPMGLLVCGHGLGRRILAGSPIQEKRS
jgi:hypothetical protein